MSHNVWGCVDPNVAPEMNDTQGIHHGDPAWIAQARVDGQCVMISPSSIWETLNESYNGLTYVAYRGSIGRPGSFWVPTAALVSVALTTLAPTPLSPSIELRKAETRSEPTLQKAASPPTTASVDAQPPLQTAPAVVAPQVAATMPSVPVQPASDSDGSGAGLFVLLLLGVGWLVHRFRRRTRPATVATAASRAQRLATATTRTPPSWTSPPSVAKNLHSKPTAIASAPAAPAADLMERASGTSPGPFLFSGGRTVETATSFAVSTAKTIMPARIVSGWCGPGQAVTVAGLTISDGMVYIGAAGGRSDGRDASVIDPSLAVAANSSSMEPLGYWPSYAGIGPEGRRRYLEWLCSGKRQPGADIGLVFIYFCGLERRLVLETPGPEEVRALITELHRLRSIYAANHSFDGYSRRLADIASFLLDPAREVAAVAEQDPTARPGEITLAVKVAIAQEVASGRPLGCDLACAVLFGLPEFAIDLRSVKDAGLSALTSLLRIRFRSAFPEGYKVHARKDSHLTLYYRGAAPGLQAELSDRAGLQGLPDPGTLTWTKLLALGTAAVRDIAPYVKALKYHPAMADSLAGVRLSPIELRDQIAIEARGWLGGLPVPVAAVPFSELASHAIGKTGVRWSMRDHQQVVDSLAAVGYGIEPDPAEGKEYLEDSSIVQIFHISSDTRCRAMIVAFAAAALVLALARTADASDSAVAERWLAAMPSRLRLTSDQVIRLRAQLAWRATSRLTVPKALRMLGEATLEEREFCAWSATEAAIATGRLDKPQITVLEHVYDLLGIAHSRLYASLHADIGAAVADANEPVLVAGEVGEALHPIPRPPVSEPRTSTPGESANRPDQLATEQPVSRRPPELVAADAEARLARIRADTDSVSALLAGIFLDDEEPTQMHDDVSAGRFAGLDIEHAALLERLVHRSSWSRAEFDAAASAAGLMPDGALETINEWSFDHFEEALVEDADPLVINVTLLPQAAEAVLVD